MKIMTSLIFTSVRMLLLCTLIFGGFYPLLVWGVAQGAFHTKANGSLAMREGKVIGSTLLAQDFSKSKYFWSRPSATVPEYNAAASGASNMNPANPKLVMAAKNRAEMLQRNNDTKKMVPADMVLASGSGLDPHISLEAAEYQLARVARARGMSEGEVRTLVQAHMHNWLTQSYVNVLELNLALDGK